MDDMSNELNSCETGCVIGSTIVNHFMYTDDLFFLHTVVA